MHEDQDTGVASNEWEGYADDCQLSNYVVWECCWRPGHQQQHRAASTRTLPPALVDSRWNTNCHVAIRSPLLQEGNLKQENSCERVMISRTCCFVTVSTAEYVQWHLYNSETRWTSDHILNSVYCLDRDEILELEQLHRSLRLWKRIQHATKTWMCVLANTVHDVFAVVRKDLSLVC